MVVALLTSLAFGACDAAVVDGRVPAAESGLTLTREGEPTPESAPALDALACLLSEDAALTVQIEAHTDARGSSTYNQRVSQVRADAVRAALLARGVADERVTAVGYGEQYPLTDNLTSAGRASNKRIELHTAPPSERPPRPEAPPPVEPAPQPAPAPVAGPAELCERARALRSDHSPADTWPGASCVAGWSCEVPDAFSLLEAALTDCLGAQRDGDELYVTVQGATFVVSAAGAGSRIRSK